MFSAFSCIRARLSVYLSYAPRRSCWLGSVRAASDLSVLSICCCAVVRDERNWPIVGVASVSAWGVGDPEADGDADGDIGCCGGGLPARVSDEPQPAKTHRPKATGPRAAIFAINDITISFRTRLLNGARAPAKDRRARACCQ